jgi:hypothetical protein
MKSLSVWARTKIKHKFESSAPPNASARNQTHRNPSTDRSGAGIIIPNGAPWVAPPPFLLLAPAPRRPSPPSPPSPPLADALPAPRTPCRTHPTPTAPPLQFLPGRARGGLPDPFHVLRVMRLLLRLVAAAEAAGRGGLGCGTADAAPAHGLGLPEWQEGAATAAGGGGCCDERRRRGAGDAAAFRYGDGAGAGAAVGLGLCGHRPRCSCRRYWGPDAAAAAPFFPNDTTTATSNSGCVPCGLAPVDPHGRLHDARARPLLTIGEHSSSSSSSGRGGRGGGGRRGRSGGGGCC